MKHKKPRQLPMAFIQCSASLKSGVRCHYRNRYGEFCGHHKEKDVARLPYVTDGTGKRRYWPLAKESK